jgi:hypothetical protein
LGARGDNKKGDNGNGVDISKMQTLVKLWMGGEINKKTGKREVPTLVIRPPELAKYYSLDKPCRILLEGRPELGGILIRYFGPLITNSNEEREDDENEASDMG